MIRVSITTLGCRVNSYESDAMAGLLRAAGFTVVPDSEPADICVVNTCTVTNIADRKSRQMISRRRKLNPDTKIIVTGCWSQREPEAALKLDGVSAVLGTTEKNRIADVCAELTGSNGSLMMVRDVMHEHTFEELSATAENRTRAYLKIQDGCDRFCSYCAIPFARGAVRSRPLDSVRKELEMLDRAGFREVVFTGIHLTDYGKDIGGVCLADAVECVNGLDNIKRLRLGSLEPHGLNDEMIARITSCEKVCPQFHLSLQSGSTSVLKRMRRGYTAEEYAVIVEKLRSAYGDMAPYVAITTDIIAGFVGETEAEHIETIDFMRRIGFARVHVFPYSRRSGTLADKMPGHLTNNEKSLRAQELIEVGKELETSFLEKHIGRTVTVLTESVNVVGLASGFTDNYIRVFIPHAPVNELAEVKIKSIMEVKKGELSLLSDSIG